MSEDKTTLTDQEVDQKLESLDGWKRSGIYLLKDYVFSDFKEINKFLPFFTKTIVEHNHHPDFCFIGGDKKVALKMTTHSEGGLTQADLNLAEALEKWNEQ